MGNSVIGPGTGSERIPQRHSQHDGTGSYEANIDGGARTKTRGVGSGSGVDGSERHLEIKRVSRRVDGETSQFAV
jgi:hypothetical protein